MRVRSGSSFVGKKLAELLLRDVSGASIVAIERGGKLIQPSASTELQPRDTLFIDLLAGGTDVAALKQQYDLDELPLSGVYFADKSQEIGMAEVIVPATSGLIGKTLLESDFRALRRLRDWSAARRNSAGARLAP